jgi:hypothetical protein
LAPDGGEWPTVLEYESGWAPKPVYMLLRRKKCYFLTFQQWKDFCMESVSSKFFHNSFNMGSLSRQYKTYKNTGFTIYVQVEAEMLIFIFKTYTNLHMPNVTYVSSIED